MTTEEKATRYNILLGEHTRISNEIQSVRGENFELNSSQIERITKLNNQLSYIMYEIQKMMG
jgi:hypothetical protein